MWKKSESEAQQPQFQAQPRPVIQPHANTPQTMERPMIGPTICIKGDLSGQEDLIIDGRVEGKIELRQHNVTVGKNGKVKADIYGKTITIEGEVQGNLYGEEQLVLRQTGTVRGNITAPRVSLEDGSNFKGSIDMSPKETSGSTAETEARITRIAAAHQRNSGETIPAATAKPDRGPAQV
jgi:cytoskeletal protein CcmA (bactofilin family)